MPWIFVNGIRANLADLDLLVKLKQAGLKRTAFGVETGDEQMIIKIDKHIDHDTIRQAFKNAKAAGIETIGFFIIGLPGDTRETMQKTIDFAIELDPMIANFSMMTPYPGTIVYEQVKQNGRFLVQDWEDYVFFDTEGALRDGRPDRRADGRDVSQGLPAVLLAAQVHRAGHEPQGLLAQVRSQCPDGLAHRRAAEREDRAAAGDGSLGIDASSMSIRKNDADSQIVSSSPGRDGRYLGQRHQRALHADAPGIPRRRRTSRSRSGTRT